MKVERITKRQALRAVRAKLPILGDKALQEEVEFAIGSFCTRCSESRALADAYRVGSQTAQSVIAKRIEAIMAAEGKAK